MSQNILEDIAEAGGLSDFAPNLGVGEHLVCLTKIELRNTREYGQKVDVEYIVVDSTVHAKGEVRGDVFFIQKNGDSGLYARKRANAFSREVVKSLGGDPDDTTPIEVNGKTMPKGQAVVIQTLSKLMDKTNPGKGLLLKVSTRKRANKEKTKEHDNNTYASVKQTREEMGARRQAMETGAAQQPVATAGSPVAPAIAAPAPTPTAPAPTMLDGIL